MDRTPQTSTPIHSTPFGICSPRSRPIATPTRLGHRRYSLADPWQTPGNAKQKRICSSSSSISTKIDSNSPGYSSRVVQYNEEYQKSSPNHQSYRSKYDKLGVFPIVHFFKKDLPCLKRKADENSQSNASELSKYNSSEHNRMLLEKIIKSSPGTPNSPNKDEVNAKSVLDALKEISRKRIQPDEEEFILNDDGKRIYLENENETISRKRQKQSAHVDEITSTILPKNQSIDELIASHSSTQNFFPPKPKEKHIEKKVSPKKSPVVHVVPVKCVNVETQTVAPPEPIKFPKPNDTPPAKKEEVPQEITPKKTSPVKIFDETPLEAMRRNRLSALMGSMSKAPSPKPINSPKTDAEKPLVSILSGNSKSPNKSNKHVTFNLPEEEKSLTNPANTINNILVPESSLHDQSAITKTSAAVVLPIVSSVESTSLLKVSEGISTGTMPISFKSPVSENSVPTISVPRPISNKSFSFAGPAPLPQLTNATSVSTNLNSNVELSSPKSKLQEFIKDNPTNSADTTNLKGGFQFELKNTSETVKPSSPFSFGAPTTTPTATTSSVISLAATTVITKGSLPTFSQSSINFGDSGVNKQLGQPTSSFSFNKNPMGDSNTTTSSNFGSTSTLSSTFTPQTTTTSSTFTPNFGTKASVANFMSSEPSKPAMFSFGQAGSTTNAVNLTSSQNNQNTSGKFSFSTENPSSTSMAFGGPPNVQITSSSMTFGGQPNVATTSSSMTFGGQPHVATTSSSPMTYGNLATSPPMAFGQQTVATTTSSISFGNVATPSPMTFGGQQSVATPSSMAFGGQPNISTTSSSLTFGGPPNVATTSSMTFGGQQNVATASPFSSSQNNSTNNFMSAPSASNVFSASTAKPATTNSFFFNSSNTFNKSTSDFNNSGTTPNFGAVSDTKSIFKPNTPSFNTTTVSTFGGTNTLSSSASTFGNVAAAAAPPQTNVFGGSFGTSGDPPPFGLNANTNFGTPNFGMSQKPAFGSNSADEKNNFLAPFGSSFGATTTASSFSTSTPSFSSGSASFNPSQPFGATNSNNNLAPPAFNPSPFEKAAPNVEITSSTFGSNNFNANPQPSQGSVFTFGSNTATKPGVFSFGSSEAPKPMFNFQSSENNSGTFGSSSKGFGATGAPSAFSPMPTPQFNVPSTGMFNIGTGGSTATTRSRPQVKGKRRT